MTETPSGVAVRRANASAVRPGRSVVVRHHDLGVMVAVAVGEVDGAGAGAATDRHIRVELVRENANETEKILRAYADLLKGARKGSQVIAEVGALEKYGVSAGTLVVVTQPHA